MAATLILTEASLAHQPLELQTKVREDFTITEMAPTRAFSHLRHYAKQVNTLNRRLNTVSIK